jgi:RHS repeat-associated protein
MSVPLASTPGRSGFGPQLSLSYESGAGNGPFGFGWSLGLPAISRKTDKGLPRYLDDDESDTFLISGAEDLVPILDGAGDRLVRRRKVHRVAYTIHLYRPRIEGLFARIERWQRDQDGVSHWRTITRDNVTTIFGYTDDARITDPHDSRRVFSYLIELTFDDKGNATHYTYVPEDSREVDRAAAHEANRPDDQRRTQRYLKAIRYGNVQPYIPDWAADGSDTPLPTDWHFRIVLDYGDHRADGPAPAPDGAWPVRPDPFSTYRPGFEVRTYRRCHRILVFHDFPNEPAVGGESLVRSTELRYSDETAPTDPRNPIYTLLESVTSVGHQVGPAGSVRQAMPPVEFSYSRPELQPEVLSLTDPDSVANLPEGTDGSRFRWVDLHGEGLAGVLTEQDGGWGYKRNLSPTNEVASPDGRRLTRARLGLLEQVPSLPAPANLTGGQQLMDLAGEGRLDLVAFDGPSPGFFAHAADSGWEPFRSFASLPRLNWSEPNLRYVDLTGDGLADVLITEDDMHTMYPSLGQLGFGEGERVPAADDERQGPHVVFADGTQTVSLADMTGDGLSDLVRVRPGEVCYWPNLGYGRFGGKVTMDDAPRLGDEERFDPRRVHWADVDGSGTSDLVYVGADEVQVVFNRSGNSWAAPHRLAVFPGADGLSSVQVVDLLGNGTACLVWSSPLPGQSRSPLRYVDLMGSIKPHLLTRIRNNLGSETRLAYAPSTRFYVRDRLAGRPWATQLPFPVQVVEHVETYDWIGRSRFVTHYAYHHGYFDGFEREFRGFGMVEQRDTETHREDTLFPELEAADEDAASFAPPVLTRTWFHTGAFVEAGAVSRQYVDEYWAEPAVRGADPAKVAAREALLLPDTVLDAPLTPDEAREAYRALKGSTLRIEVYAEDGTGRAEHPYTVTEQDFAVRRLQPFGPNRHAVFLTHARESLTYHYERQPDDPRLAHVVTLEVDDFANVRRSVSIGYGRRAGHADPEPNLSAEFRAMLGHDQTRLHIGATENVYTDSVHRPDEPALIDAYRAPLPAETVTAELTGIAPAAGRFSFAELDRHWTTLWTGAHDIAYEDVSTPDIEGVGMPVALARRVVERSRTLYRPDDLTGLLPLRTLHPRALPGETYVLALTSGLLGRVFGARVPDATLVEGGYVRLAGSSDWWRPSGRLFYSPGDADPPTQELATARAHFFQPRRTVDPFGAISRVTYDDYDLLPIEATDAVGNVSAATNDYRQLQPFRSTDPNGNHAEVAFDCLGEVVGTAVSGKAGEGDSLAGFDADLSEGQIADAHARPFADPLALLGKATSRIVHDRLAYLRTRALPSPDAPAVYTLTRETHASELGQGQTPRLRHLFVYFDGFGREAQHKAQAERGPVPGVGPDISPRWVGSGWSIYNNKGKPVRRYEPFFTDTHRFEFGRRAGVSSVIFYDPLEREIATLHPDNSFEKTVFDAWCEHSWDANDTVLIADPRADGDVGDAFRRLLGPAEAAFTSWHDRRIGRTLGATAEERAANADAAQKAASHAGTPTITHLDSLGRKCLAVADNGGPDRFATRTAMDTENKPLAVIDARGRRAMEYCLREPLPGGGFRYVAGYDLAGEPLYHNNLDGGERRLLGNVAGRPIRSWDTRGQAFRLRYDAMQRLTHRFVERPDGTKALLERSVYGERHPDPIRNLKGQLFRQYDGAGVSSQERYDFKGNLLETARQFARDLPIAPLTPDQRQTPDWSAITEVLDAPTLDLAALDAAAAPLLVAADRFAAASRLDALNRTVQMVLPHPTGTPPSVVQPAYNEANLLETVHVWIRRLAAPTALLDPATADIDAVTGVQYNAHGQRLEITCGNGTVTTQTFDEETRRLVSLTTTRPHPDPDARVVQALSYSYDPHGNITRLRDDADIHNVVFFRNQRVDPTADYTYDAIYRLTNATGREHLGQTGNALNAPRQITNDDSPRTHAAPSVRLLNPGDGNAVATYTERYRYDPVGNLEQMIHLVAGGGWTRRYAYTATSRITPAEVGNRLTATSLPGDAPLGPYSATYDHDAHGNVTRMPHLPVMAWDERDRLKASSRQVVNTGTQETTYYAYEAGGERLRKVTYRQAGVDQVPTRKTERLYLGAIEIHREYDPDGTLSLERETLHALLDHRSVVTAETRTVDAHGTDPAAAQLFRYQYGNHLGSTILELDDQAALVTYEEYFPYGATAYQAVRSLTEVPKAQRYTGEERDEENDLYYHGGRYYAPWLGRWTACDPAGLEDGPNLYMYVHGNPVAISDPTGLWGWRQVAVIAAVVVVGTVVTVATAGVAGPLVAGAVASVGLSGAAATVATGVVVGAVAGAAGGAAGELTRQVGSGEQISGAKIGRAALVGAALGAVTGGVGAYASTARGAAQLARVSTAVRASSIGRAGATAARVASAGARAVARVPGARQVASVVQGGARLAGRALQGIESGGRSVGGGLAQIGFREGSRGAVAAAAYSATGSAASAFGVAARSGAGSEAGSLSTLFRGTSEGFPGNPALQKIGITPATTDPGVATIFATEAQTYGRGVVHIARAKDLAGVTIGEGNVLANLEREVGVHIAPAEFAQRASTTISAEQAKAALGELGISVPAALRGPAAVDAALRATPKLSAEQVQRFLQIVQGP